jgi:hypothetical protein
LKKWKGPGEFTEVAKSMEPNWYYPQFLNFKHLTLTAGERKYISVFLLTGGSGQVKGAARIPNINVKFDTIMLSFLHAKGYEIV